MLLCLLPPLLLLLLLLPAWMDRSFSVGKGDDGPKNFFFFEKVPRTSSKPMNSSGREEGNALHRKATTDVPLIPLLLSVILHISKSSPSSSSFFFAGCATDGWNNLPEQFNFKTEFFPPRPPLQSPNWTVERERERERDLFWFGLGEKTVESWCAPI